MGLQDIFDNMGKKFWETEPTMWDSVNDAGLRYESLPATC